MFKKFLGWVMIIAFVMAGLSSCEWINDVILNPDGSSDANDIDGDGLSNQEELDIYNTNPFSADTDGDGFTDYEELFTFSFNPDQDIAKFNPLIADMPEYEINIISEPDIWLNMTTSSGSSVSQSVTEGIDNAQAFSTATVSETSSSIEVNWGVEIGFEGGVTDGKKAYALGHITGEVGGAYQHTKTISLSEEQSSEVVQSYENARENATSEEYEITDGAMAIVVDVVNTGHISFTVANMNLSALLMDLTDEDTYWPLATLNPDNESTTFQNQTIAPNNTWESLIFETDGLTIAQTEDLIYDPSGLLIKVSSLELVDVEHNAIAHEQTAINANTARISIDDGNPATDVERYNVAVTQKRDEDGNISGLTVSEIFRDILQISYTTSEVSMINADGIEKTNYMFTSVNDVTVDNENNYIWVADCSLDSFEDLSYGNIENVVLNAGDVLALVYLVDNDNDGIGYREEKLYGSSDLLADTDGDGLTDYFEIRTGWIVNGETVKSNPIRLDSDYDGIDDSDELALGTNPVRSDSDDDGFSDYLENESGTNPLEATNALLSSLVISDGVVLSPEFDPDIHEYTSATALEEIEILAITDSPTSSLMIDGVSATPGLYSDPVSIDLGENQIVITVTSDGGLVTDTYTIGVENSEETMQLGSLTLSEGTLVPAFSASTYTYEVEIQSDELTIIASALNPLEAVTVSYNSENISFNSGYEIVDLDVNAENTVTITVSNVDDTDSQEYELTITNLLEDVDLTPDYGFEPILASGEDSIIINWKQVADARISDYLIVRSLSDTLYAPLEQSYDYSSYPHDLGNGYVIVAKEDNSQSTVTDTDLESGTDYYYSIFAHYFREELSDGTTVNQHFWSPGASVSGTTNPRMEARVHIFIDQIYVSDAQNDAGTDNLELICNWRIVSTGNTDYTTSTWQTGGIDQGSSWDPAPTSGYNYLLLHSFDIPRIANAYFRIEPDIWEDDWDYDDDMGIQSFTFNYSVDSDQFEGSRNIGIPANASTTSLDVDNDNSTINKGRIEIRYRFGVQLVDP